MSVNLYQHTWCHIAAKICWVKLWFNSCVQYRGADKSLARPGRKQATVTEDFDVHISYLLS